MTEECKWLSWQGCYEQGWGNMITKASFAHPCKFSYSLAVRIVRHGLDVGHWKPGDRLGDPFGGIAGGGIVAAYHGLRWVGVELEPTWSRLAAGYHCPGLTKQEWVRWCNRFGRKWDYFDMDRGELCPTCTAGAQTWYRGDGVIPSHPPHRFVGNFDLHRLRWEVSGDPMPQIIQGDSRDFARLVGECSGILTSPPFQETVTGGTAIWGKLEESHNRQYTGKSKNCGNLSTGDTPGNIGQLKSGDLDGVITSPPYSEGTVHGGGHGIDWEKAKDEKAGRKTSPARDGLGEGYGDTPGNIGNLPGGSLQGIVTSPPFQDSMQSHDVEFENRRQISRGRDIEGMGHKGSLSDYGTTQGQIGNLPGGSLDLDDAQKSEGKNSSGGTKSQREPITYWSEMLKIYQQTYLAMKPNGVMALVIKDYVRAGKRVPLCDQTVQLLEHCGFHVFARARCWLVKTHEHPGLFGEPIVKTKSRKSFFRRLAEKNGSPRIDFEEVIFCRK
jgi:hypothetical protein